MKKENNIENISIGLNLIPSRKPYEQYVKGEVNSFKLKMIKGNRLVDPTDFKSTKNIGSTLFAEEIFGAEKYFQCKCGNYKGAQYANIKCEKCFVTVTDFSVRSENMGVIKLPPNVWVCHPWFFYAGNPVFKFFLTNYSFKVISDLIYCQSYLVISPGKTKLKKFSIISIADYEKLKLDNDSFLFKELEILQETYKGNEVKFFEAITGGAAVKTLLDEIDLKTLKKEIINTLKLPEIDISEADKLVLSEQLKILIEDRTELTDSEKSFFLEKINNLINFIKDTNEKKFIQEKLSIFIKEERREEKKLSDEKISFIINELKKQIKRNRENELKKIINNLENFYNLSDEEKKKFIKDISEVEKSIDFLLKEKKKYDENNFFDTIKKINLKEIENKTLIDKIELFIKNYNNKLKNLKNFNSLDKIEKIIKKSNTLSDEEKILLKKKIKDTFKDNIENQKLIEKFNIYINQEEIIKVEKLKLKEEEIELLKNKIKNFIKDEYMLEDFLNTNIEKDLSLNKLKEIIDKDNSLMDDLKEKIKNKITTEKNLSLNKLKEIIDKDNDITDELREKIKNEINTEEDFLLNKLKKEIKEEWKKITNTYLNKIDNFMNENFTDEEMSYLLDNINVLEIETQDKKLFIKKKKQKLSNEDIILLSNKLKEIIDKDNDVTDELREKIKKEINTFNFSDDNKNILKNIFRNYIGLTEEEKKILETKMISFLNKKKLTDVKRIILKNSMENIENLTEEEKISLKNFLKTFINNKKYVLKEESEYLKSYTAKKITQDDIDILSEKIKNFLLKRKKITDEQRSLLIEASKDIKNLSYENKILLKEHLKTFVNNKKQLSIDEKLFLDKYLNKNKVTFNKKEIDFLTIKLAKSSRSTLTDEDKSSLYEKLNNLINIKNNLTEEEKNFLNEKLKIIIKYENKGILLSDFFLNHILVLPINFRPFVEVKKLSSLVSSHLNDLYKGLIIAVSSYLDTMEGKLVLIKQNAILTFNIQKAVDKLFLTDEFSLAAELKGKEGVLRNAIISKRINYSGRSVIVCAPELKLDEAFLPRDMILTILKNLVSAYLIRYGIAKNISHAKILIDTRAEVVWDILNEVVEQHVPCVLINRQPTLHKNSMVCFKIKLWPKFTVGLPPGCFAAKAADCDGDTCLVQVQLMTEAVLEALFLATPQNNFTIPTNGNLSVKIDKESALGIYYITKVGKERKDIYFSNYHNALLALEKKLITYNNLIEVFVDDKLIQTTAGRLLIYSKLPSFGIDKFNRPFKVNEIQDLLKEIRIFLNDDDRLCDFINDLQEIGFNVSNEVGFSFSIDDFLRGDKKLVEKKRKELLESQSKILEMHVNGFISESELERLLSSNASEFSKDLQSMIIKEMKEAEDNPVVDAIDSGIRGSVSSLIQMCLCKGVPLTKDGQVMLFFITESHIDGLPVISFNILHEGVRESFIRIAYLTPQAGYLARQLVYHNAYAVINARDCSKDRKPYYLIASNIIKDGILVRSFESYILGRTVAFDVLHPDDKNRIILHKNTLITQNEIDILKHFKITSLAIRTPALCQEVNGICIACYGANSDGKWCNIGDHVGDISAQSASEPTTQTTLRSFHSGGVAKYLDTENFCKTLFSGYVSFNLEVLNTKRGVVSISRHGTINILNEKKYIISSYDIPYGANIIVKEGQFVDIGTILAKWERDLAILATFNAEIKYLNMIENDNYKVVHSEETGKTYHVILASKNIPRIKLEGADNKESIITLVRDSILFVKDGDKVVIGDVIGKIRFNISTVNLVEGLPKIINAFQANKPEFICTLSPIDGLVNINHDNKKGKVTVKIIGDTTFEFQTKDSLLLIYEGQHVKKGDYLTQGSIYLPHYLDVEGPEKTIEYFLNEVQEVYITQGVNNLNCKHLEVILKGCLQYHIVIDGGTSQYLPGEIIKENDAFYASKNMKVKRLFLGIKQSISEGCVLNSLAFERVLNAIRDGINSLPKPIESNTKYMLGGLLNSGTGLSVQTIRNNIYLNAQKEKNREFGQ